MKILLSALIILSLASLSLFVNSSINNRDENAQQKFETYCANCHGSKMERFAGKTWSFGNSDKEMFESIKYGRPSVGMPSFKELFNDDDIKSISNYIKTTLNSPDNKPSLFKFPKVIKSNNQNFKIDTVITGLSVPWGMAFLPDGDMLVTERSGELFRFRKGKLDAIVEGVPKVYQRGQGGLLDIKLHPDYKTNGWIYIIYSEPSLDDEAEGGCTAMIRCRLKNDKLVDIQKLFRAYPNSTKGVHFGSRLVFDSINHIYLTVGERGNRPNAQTLTNHCGKVHRLNDDGTIPNDNPFVNIKDAIPSIWSYGHRNPQGIDINPTNGQIWENEHGPKGGDEINIIKKGRNYGWPEITFGINYNGTIITNDTAKAGMEQPLHYWIPSIAPSSMVFVTGDRYPEWKGDLLSGSLSFRYLERTILKNNKVIGREKLLENAGRVRNVVMSPDNYIYVAVEYPGIIVKLTPVNE